MLASAPRQDAGGHAARKHPSGAGNWARHGPKRGLLKKKPDGFQAVGARSLGWVAVTHFLDVWSSSERTPVDTLRPSRGRAGLGMKIPPIVEARKNKGAESAQPSAAFPFKGAAAQLPNSRHIFNKEPRPLASSGRGGPSTTGVGLPTRVATSAKVADGGGPAVAFS